MIEKSKIAIITTVANFKLYSKTATIFPKGIDKIVIDGTNGIYGLNSINIMFKMLKNKQYEWVIMADEDIFFYDSNIVFDLIEHMNENNYQICGIRDGGFVKHRVHNPAAINTFFSIINFKELSKFFNYRSVLTYQKYIPELYVNKNYTSFKYNYNIENPLGVIICS